MTGIWGTVIVCAVLMLAVALAVRSIWKSRRSGGHCTGNCARCGQCGGGSRKRPSCGG